MAVQYINLRNQGGTIINKDTGQSYADPTQLAVDLGIKADDIEWGRIADETVGTPTATGSITPRDFEPEDPIKPVDNPMDETNYAGITAGALPPPPTELDIEQQKAETEASTLSTSITDLLEESQTEGAYTQEQMDVAGVSGYEKDVQDLKNQMRTLEMEKQANDIRIENQTKTTGHISGELRKNERDTAIRTLTLSAQLQAKQGSLTLALNQAQRAVDLKYKPIKDKLEVLREQYNMNKDALERIDKKQADALKEKLDKWKVDMDNKKKLESDINSIALKAAEGGASMSVVTAIQGAKTYIEAIGLASGFLDTNLQIKLAELAAKGLSEEESSELLSPTEAAALGVPYGTTKGEAFGQTPKETLTGTEKINKEIDLSNKFESYAKPSKAALTQVNLINSSWNQIKDKDQEGINAASQGILVTFQKILDPTSVVRESEYARSGAGQSLLSRMQGMYDKMAYGGAGVTKEGLKEFVDAANAFSQGYKDSVLDYAKRIETQADNYGLDINNILTPDVLDILEKSKPEEINYTDAIDEAISSGYEPEEILDTLKNDEDLAGMIDEAVKEGHSAYNILLKIKELDFNGEGSDSATLEKISQAIGQFESGGNYKAIGKVTANGDRAYGKYQVMGKNIPSWTKEALGKSMTIKEFLASPKAQDKVAHSRMGKLLAQYGNISDVASVWFSGRPMKKAGNARDVNNTTVPKYIKNVISIYNRLS